MRDLALYVIIDRQAARCSLAKLARQALAGGATAIQLRDKLADGRTLYQEALALRELCRQAKVPLIINDRLDVALAVEADGVHLGQDDLPLEVVRRLVGPEKLVGMSVDTVAQAQAAAAAGASYLGVGDLFGTRSKPDAGLPIGLARLAEIARSVAIPVVGIGGITRENAASVIAAGASGVAVISAVLGASDPTAAACELAMIVRDGRRA
jgi:thiamine-phosphate pyrophosphorylase